MIGAPEWQAVVIAAAIVLGAPWFSGLRAYFAARFGGHSGPRPTAGYRRHVARLFAHSVAVPRTATSLQRLAPALAFAAACLAAWVLARLVTSDDRFTSDDAIAFAAWLFTARVAATLAAVDAGSALVTLAHSRARVVSLLVEPTLLLSLLAGTLVTPIFGATAVLAALGFALAAWSHGASHGVPGDASGPGLALTVLSQEVAALCLWGAFIAVFLPWAPDAPRLHVLAVAIELVLVAGALGAADARMVRSGLSSARQAPITALAFAVVAMLAAAITTGVTW